MANITIGTVSRVDSRAVFVSTLVKPVAPCNVIINSVTYKAMSAFEHNGELRMELIGGGTPVTANTVAISDTTAVTAVRPWHDKVANTVALQAITKASRPNTIKCMTGTSIYQYFDGATSGDIQPTDSSGLGTTLGNGWWIQIA